MRASTPNELPLEQITVAGRGGGELLVAEHEPEVVQCHGVVGGSMGVDATDHCHLRVVAACVHLVSVSFVRGMTEPGRADTTVMGLRIRNMVL